MRIRITVTYDKTPACSVNIPNSAWKAFLDKLTRCAMCICKTEVSMEQYWEMYIRTYLIPFEMCVLSKSVVLILNYSRKHNTVYFWCRIKAYLLIAHNIRHAICSSPHRLLLFLNCRCFYKGCCMLGSYITRTNGNALRAQEQHTMQDEARRMS